MSQNAIRGDKKGAKSSNHKGQHASGSLAPTEESKGPGPT